MTQLGTKKSRNGCTRCKRRRVKCDERLPCSNCARRNEACSLLTSQSSPASTTAQSSTGIDTSDWLQDLELMHHYALEDQVFGTERRPRVQEIWRKVVPELAAKHPFLMHSILALSAIHIAKQRPAESVKYQDICAKHQSVALERVHELIPNMNADNANAIFAFSASVSAISLARATLIAEQRMAPYHISMDEVAETILLTQGVRSIVRRAYQWVRHGPLDELLNGFATPEGADVGIEVYDRFEALNKMLDSFCGDVETLRLCREASDNLLDSYKCVRWHAAENDLESGIVVRWIAMADQSLARLIQNHHPPALVLLAHYVVLFVTMRSGWFIHDWPQYVFRGIEMAIDPDFSEWLEWPRQQFESELEILHIPQRQESDALGHNTG
ncbi:hypothetical protein K431DRAFT_323546 [Polychaeton citri CBS 116435]|uniref:Zn(2)-C6 fungal-type domain-containing protein n=1 Tax=Polychaeton citri CBS 116435 TaxID=1314669 RepID=A0A9P4PZB1_9PEZI|nr:hypothetical protein K431DRAFT_323546 [Polychaeton citri CBS 116435]